MNYTELKQKVADWMHRTDLTPQMDIFTELTETDINSTLRVSEMETRLPITFTDAFTDLPADFLATRALQVDADQRRPIKFYTPDQLDKLFQSLPGGTARGAAIHGGQIELRPAPSTESPLDAEWSYYKRVPSLVSNANTDILTNYPLIYLAGMLFNANKYTQDDEQANYWATVYTNQITVANKIQSRYHLPEIRAF